MFNIFYFYIKKDPWRERWDLLLIMLLFYAGIVTPFLISFYPNETIGWKIINYCVDVLFMIDLIINFFSAYYDDEENLITDRFVKKKYYSFFF